MEMKRKQKIYYKGKEILWRLEPGNFKISSGKNFVRDPNVIRRGL